MKYILTCFRVKFDSFGLFGSFDSFGGWATHNTVRSVGWGSVSGKLAAFRTNETVVYT